MGLYEFIDKKWTLWFVVVILVALIIFTYFTAGVYREVAIQGLTWEWVNAPEGESGILYSWDEPNEEWENWAPPPGMELKSLSGVYVWYNTVYKDRQYDKGVTISGKDGWFSKKARGWKVMGEVTLIATVTKDGYNSINATFVNKGKPNALHIILTRAQ